MKLNNSITLILISIFLNLGICVFGTEESVPYYTVVDCGIEFNHQPLKEVMEKTAVQTGVKYSLGKGVNENMPVSGSLWGKYSMDNFFFNILDFPYIYEYREGTYWILRPDDQTSVPTIHKETFTKTIRLKNKKGIRIKEIFDEIGYNRKDDINGYGIIYTVDYERNIMTMTGHHSTYNMFKSLIKYLDENQKNVEQSLEKIGNGLLERAKERKKEGKDFRAICGMAIIIYKKIGKEEMILKCKELIGEKEIEVLRYYKDEEENDSVPISELCP